MSVFRIIMHCTLFLSLLSFAFAGNVSFEATVNTPKITLNESLQLTLTITGSKNSIDPINLPTIEGFSATYIGPRTSISITNGDYHSERSFVYQLLPTKSGSLIIPPITTQIDGSTFTTQSINVAVSDSTTQNGNSDISNQEQTGELKDKIKFALELPKDSAFINEPLILTLRLLINGLQVRNVQYPQLEKEGYSLGALTYQQGTQVINGIKFDVVEFKVPLYPNKSGDIKIGPAQIGANIIYQQSNISDDFFQGFLRNYATRPLTATSGTLTLHVMETPQEGKPEDFSGAVGQFDLKVSVSPTQVKVGDPITIKSVLSGNGLLKDIDLPKIIDKNFKTYDPKITIIEGAKIVEQVIIPISEDLKNIPALNFTYFDPSAQQYRTVSQGPFPIHVVAAPVTEEFKAIGYNDLSSPVNIMKINQQEKSFFVTLLYKAMNTIKYGIMQWWFWLGCFICGMVIALIVVWRSYQKRLTHDIAFYRRLRAKSKAKSSFKQVSEALTQNQPKIFYEYIHRTLMNFVTDASNVPAGSMTHASIDDFFIKHKINDQDRILMKELLAKCDEVRFAEGTATVEQMREHFLLLKQLIEIIRRKI